MSIPPLSPLTSVHVTCALVIRGGSAGHWGERFVMWPQVQLSDAEVQQLIEWILSQ